jgi:hypothetical protein
VSRAAAALGALALVTTLSLAPPASGPLTGSTRAVAADCAWQRHSKRVVKQVRRDGRSRRLVRTKHWWACVPAPAQAPTAAAPPVTAAPAPPADPTPPTVTEPEPKPSIGRLSVKAKEWSLTLSKSDPIAPGEVIVELNNEGTDSHNLKLQGEEEGDLPLEVSEAGPSEHRTARFTLHPGTYQLWCSLPEHRERGMSVTLQVAGG